MAGARSARGVALEVVRRVCDEGAYSNLLLRSLLDRSALDTRDRSFAAELAYGTLRYRLPVDGSIRPFLDRPFEEAPPLARAALRLGAYQLLRTRVPPHAAVGETVGLVPSRQRGFVNAVLRGLAAEPPIPPEGSGDEALSLRTGLAAWWVAELRRLLPEDEVEVAAHAIASPAALSLRTNPCRTTDRELEAALRAAGRDPERGRIHPGTFRLPSVDPRSLPGFGEGRFAVQDEASAWVVDVLDPRPGERVVDACAGPGGKAGDVACRTGVVIAGDRSVRRAALARDAARRLGVRALVLAQDAAVPGLRGGVDRVLVDGPCSGLGTARRRPELLWRGDRRDLSGLARLQVRLAVGASSLLRPGGVLVYSVCTFTRAETDAACDALLGTARKLRPDPFRGPEGDLVERARLWPHRHGTDAMFVARFRRLGTGG